MVKGKEDLHDEELEDDNLDEGKELQDEELEDDNLDEGKEDEELEDDNLEDDEEDEELEEDNLEEKGGGEKEEDDLDEEKEEDLNKSFSQEELKGILKSRLARERKTFDKEIDKLVEERLKEKERKSKMTEEEILQEQLSEKEKALQEREQELNFRERFTKAEEELRRRGLHTPFTKYVVTEDTEKTEANIEEFQELYNRSVKEGVKEALRGETPKGNRKNRNRGVSVKDFKKMDYGEKVSLKLKDEGLYNKLRELSRKQ